MSAGNAGIVANPPPYILKIVKRAISKISHSPPFARLGISRKSPNCVTKKMT